MLEKNGSNPSTTDKVKATFCLSLEGLKGLEDIHYNLRRTANNLENRNKISKSLIVDRAIQVILNDFNVRKEEGYLGDIICK